MKIKVTQQQALILEDILLNVYFGFPTRINGELAAEVRDVLIAVQERVYRDV